MSVGERGTSVGRSGAVWSRFLRRGDTISVQVGSSDIYNIREGAEKLVAGIATVGNKYDDG